MPASAIWQDSKIRLFVSHVSSARAEIGDIAEVLDRFGFSTFVAHADIEPTREWSSVIEEALTTCDVLVAFLTKDFHASLWTDQEVGWAMGRGALVVPVDVGATPYGFIGRYQALRSSLSSTWESAELVTRATAVAVFDGQRAIAERLTTLMPDVIAKAFELTPSFDLGRFNFALVELVPPHLWNEELLVRLQLAAEANGQLRECGLKDRGRLPDVLTETVARVRTLAGAAASTRGQTNRSADLGNEQSASLDDAPILNWQSPAVTVLPDGRIAVDVWCSNEGPIGSVARVRARRALMHNVGTPPTSGLEMDFEEFEVDTSIYSVHAAIDNRFLLKMRTRPAATRQLGNLQFTWQVAYTDSRFRVFLTQASVVAFIPANASGRLDLVDRPALDNTDAATRIGRYEAIARQEPGVAIDRFFDVDPSRRATTQQRRTRARRGFEALTTSLKGTGTGSRERPD
jgi:TIR domain-containing protein